ncbi:hypothetical protein VaNZ11_005357, partial [Volvox africanus]
MGVRGLTRLLVNAGARPRVVSLQDNEAEGRKDKLLLVDAFNVMYYLLSKVGDSIDWMSSSFHRELYQETCRYFGGLQRSGLQCILIVDSAPPPWHELTYTERTREALVSGFVLNAEPVMFQACRDLGLEIIRAVDSADELLLAWALRHRDTLFAVMSEDSDFFVYGVSKIVHPRDVVIDAHFVSLQVWDSEVVWRNWHVAAVGPAGAYMPTLLRRAQIAAVLGNDTSKDLRRRLEQRRSAAFRAGLQRGVMAPVSLSMAVCAVVQLPSHVRGLDLNFFRKPPISLRNFGEEDLDQVNKTVQEYLNNDRAARDGTAILERTLTEAALPWLDPAVARRVVTTCSLPGCLRALACRGFTGIPLPDPYWKQLRPLRCAIAEMLLGNRAVGGSYWYEPAANILYRLTAPPKSCLLELPLQDAAAKYLCGCWFRPMEYLPDVPVDVPIDKHSTEAVVVVQQLRQSTVQQTVARLQELEPCLPASMAVLYALMVHGVDPDPAAWDEAAVRELLLPGVPLRYGKDVPVSVASAVAADQDEASERPRTSRGKAMIDVGSALDKHDWDDIDDKEVVAKVRSGMGYKLLREIQPWDQLVAARGRKGAAAVGGNAMFSLARRALEAGPRSPEWAEAQCAWSGARLKDRQQALADMWSSANRWAASAAGTPMRHRHQQELLDLVDEHLRSAEQQSQNLRRRPLHVILSTPTGSGKTFTAVMMHKHILLDRERVYSTAAGRAAGPGSRGGAGSGGGADGCAAEERTGHPQTILVYSVPTKQVLKRVGQECEAHGVVYWTAARDGELFQVRRPYSIRTKRGGGSTGTGSMRQQLEENYKRGATSDDLGGGKPDVIIADIYATAALVQTASEAPADKFYRSSNLVLYLDEPNMGIHLHHEECGLPVRDMVRNVICRIMAFAPPTTILASATLPTWDELPAWWKGSGAAGATHVVITQEPYELPLCRLSVLDDVSGQLVSVSPLDLFEDAAQLATTLEHNPRARVLMLRYFSPDHANKLLGLEAAADSELSAAVAADGKSGSPKKAAKSEAGTSSAESNGGKAGEEKAEEENEEAKDDAWMVLDQDVRGLRSELLEPALRQLAAQPERFQQLREEWKATPVSVSGNLRDVLSKQGVTLVATMEPRALALQLAGKSADPERWAAEARTVRAKVRDAAAAKRTADKARERAAKRGDEDGGRAGRHDDGMSGAGRVALRPGLTVWADEADDVEDDDTLVMLSKGFAYTTSREVEPLVKRLYQQALLYVPERAGARPPLHTLVVDYSAIYGTDCPAVDTIVLCADLGNRLSWEDHQQFMGRLR